MEKRYSKHSINELLGLALGVIKERYAIDLEWAEKEILKQYISYCKDLFDNKFLRESPHGAAIHLFMLDTFGLDSVTLSQLTKSKYDLTKPEEIDLWLEDGNRKKEQLQAHIRNNIQTWRDEREYI